MAQFDCYRRKGGEGFWVDCQAEVLASLDTRFVVPLLPLNLAPIPAAHLNPLFEIEGAAHSFLAQFVGTIPVAELGGWAGSLESERYRIGNALDFLLTGV